MILFENTLISEEIFEEEFICNLSKCKGICCVEGEYGAPLEEEEIGIIKHHLPKILPYLSEEAKQVINDLDFFETDPDNDLVTSCVNGRDCVFAVKENGVYACAIEKAFNDKVIDFQKPISCHLYPIRLEKLKEYTGINYSRWNICNDACILGKKENTKVYQFLKNPLIRKFGKDWYDGLEFVAIEYLKSTK